MENKYGPCHDKYAVNNVVIATCKISLIVAHNYNYTIYCLILPVLADYKDNWLQPHIFICSARSTDSYHFVLSKKKHNFVSLDPGLMYWVTKRAASCSSAKGQWTTSADISHQHLYFRPKFGQQKYESSIKLCWFAVSNGINNGW